MMIYKEEEKYLRGLADALDSAQRSYVPTPGDAEGRLYIILSDELVREISKKLREIAETLIRASM